MNHLPSFAARGDWRSCGQAHEHTNGNGSLMRILPLSLWVAAEPPVEIIRKSFEVSALTYAHPRSKLCCALYSLVVQAVLQGPALPTALATAAAVLAPHVPPAERAPLARLLDGTILTAAEDAVRSSGYVVHTLEAALWCCHRYPDFSAAVLAAVNLGGDAETTGAGAAGLAGVRHGRGALPAAWVNALAQRAEVVARAERFAAAAGALPPGAGKLAAAPFQRAAGVITSAAATRRPRAEASERMRHRHAHEP